MADKKKILVVDDEQDIITYLETVFEDNDYDVVTARTGKEAFDKAKSEKPDMITLDITMPEESGLRCYRDLCGDADTRDIPVIIITGVSYGYKSFEKFITSRKQVPPPAGFFEKPVEREDLLKKTRLILG
ncbi:response regulator [bacterium]|nr:response regulator [bacterium]MBU1638230.1 response regulator [bacterium]MBU1881084.1 response regulator [bacterium]